MLMVWHWQSFGTDMISETRTNKRTLLWAWHVSWCTCSPGCTLYPTRSQSELMALGESCALLEWGNSPKGHRFYAPIMQFTPLGCHNMQIPEKPKPRSLWVTVSRLLDCPTPTPPSPLVIVLRHSQLLHWSRPRIKWLLLFSMYPTAQCTMQLTQ